MAIAHVETNTDASNTATSTISGHTVSGSNPVLVVKVATRDTDPNQVTGILWNTDEALEKLNSDINGNAGVEIWFLKNPTATTADVVISMSDSNRCVSAASTYSGVDPINPFRVAANNSANGSTGNPTVAITALADEMVVDSMCQVSAGPDTASASDTERHNTAATGGGTDTRGASQEKASAGAEETLIWTMSSNDNWAICAGALQAPQPATYDKEFTTDAILKKSDNDKEFTTDAFLQVKDNDKEFTTDAILKATTDKEFTVNAILKKSDNDKEFTVDAFLQVKDNDVTFTADAIITLIGEKEFTTDAILKKSDNDKDFTVDSILKKSDIDKEFTVDAFLVLTSDKTFTTDSLLQAQDQDKEFTADAFIQQLDNDKTFTADSILKKSDIDKTFTADAILESEGVVTYDKTFTVDAILESAFDRAGGPIRRRPRIIKEYEMDIYAEVIKEKFLEIGIYIPLKIKREREILISSNIFKETETDMNLLIKMDYRKLREILDVI